jgi:hypothetical protein
MQRAWSTWAKIWARTVLCLGLGSGSVGSACVRRASAGHGKARWGLGGAAASSPRVVGGRAPASRRSSLGYVLWLRHLVQKVTGI